MSFLKLPDEWGLRLVDWGLPASIIIPFVTELKRRYGSIDPSEVPRSRKLGMNDNVVILDPEDANKSYVFFVRLARNDDDFWITFVSCMGVDSANRIFWTMPD